MATSFGNITTCYFGDSQLLKRQQQEQEQQRGQKLQVQLVPAVTRNMAAKQDLIRLFIPPTFLFAFMIVTIIVVYNQWEILDGIPLSVALSDMTHFLIDDDNMQMTTLLPSSTSSSFPVSSLFFYDDADWTMMDRLIKLCTTTASFLFGYIALALPAVRVVLTERDAILTNGIQSACQRAGKNGRVVAVLGLLHVNGVAKRMLDDGEK